MKALSFRIALSQWKVSLSCGGLIGCPRKDLVSVESILPTEYFDIDKQEIMLNGKGCPKNMLSIRDALEALEGKWKLLILFALSDGPRRFKELSKIVEGITDKTLSKELKSLEGNKLLRREVYDTFPPTVEYSMTAHGRTLEKVLEELHFWGLAHRKEIMGKKEV